MNLYKIKLMEGFLYFDEPLAIGIFEKGSSPVIGIPFQTVTS